MAPARNARERSTKNIIVSGEIFFLEGKTVGRPSERIAIQSLTINNTICAYRLSQSHCEGWRCGCRVNFRIPIANDDSAWLPCPAQSLNVVAKSPCLRPHGVCQVRSGCVSGTSVIIYNPQPLYNSNLSITPPFALRETVFGL